MEIKVYTIKLDPQRWVRNLIVYVALPVGVFLGAAMTVRAGGALTTFKWGEPISSMAVNDNFTILKTAVDDLNNAVGQLQGRRPVFTNATKTYSLDAKFCGATASQYTGHQNGYAAVKTLCEVTCNSSSAHMCTGEELVRFTATGGAAPSGWYSLSVGYTDSSSKVINDCSGWTEGTITSYYGPWWRGSPTLASCTSDLSDLCCD